MIAPKCGQMEFTTWISGRAQDSPDDIAASSFDAGATRAEGTPAEHSNVLVRHIRPGDTQSVLLPTNIETFTEDYKQVLKTLKINNFKARHYAEEEDHLRF